MAGGSSRDRDRVYGGRAFDCRCLPAPSEGGADGRTTAGGFVRVRAAASARAGAAKARLGPQRGLVFLAHGDRPLYHHGRRLFRLAFGHETRVEKPGGWGSLTFIAGSVVKNALERRWCGGEVPCDRRGRAGGDERHDARLTS